ncbi:GH25 family lysozyme [Megasphaera sueciensis]|uniref:GH25 family lysozyme n=1 Tax=Megasphaera sueciensis TaxID=349094 RepID=UPI003D094128
MKQGIDVSYCQKNFDFNEAVNQEKKFCIVRIGEHNYMDDLFPQHLNGAIDAGMDVGVYFVARGLTPNDIEAEAQFFADSIKQNISAELKCGVWLDIEECYYDQKLSVQQLTDLVSSFITVMNRNGYDCGIYASYNMLNQMDVSQFADYVKFFPANYGPSCAFKEEHPEKQVILWQYSDSDGQLDLDVMYEEGE